MKYALPVACAALAASLLVNAQPKGFNYDESKVPDFNLPDPLTAANGKKITTAEQWPARRAEIHEAFATQIYGRSPQPSGRLRFEQFDEKRGALNGEAIRRQVTVYFSDDDDGPSMDLLIYTPAASDRPVPAFLGLNFEGNHAVHPDPAIRLSTRWMRNGKKGVVDHRATEAARGNTSGRWAADSIVARGYGLVTVYYGDIDPDYDDGFENGVHSLFDKPKPDEWGSISTWAWGLSRALDYLETDPRIDGSRVAVLGHSRLGKTALWAGANDERFALVISNNSGCGGAALSRRRFGETVRRINTSFPHWFCDNFNQYNDKEDELPVDQHMLMSLIAPRPVYVASAVKDQWADPHGEFLSARHADPVYRLLGTDGIGSTEFPDVDQPVTGAIGYHIRSGGHDVTEYDWARYLDFADRHLR